MAKQPTIILAGVKRKENKYPISNKIIILKKLVHICLYKYTYLSTYLESGKIQYTWTTEIRN